jgi:hypothetical protein
LYVTSEERRAARAKWTTTVFATPAEADAADVDFWLRLSVEERISLVGTLSLEAFRRSVGDDNARPELQRSALRISRP